MDIEKIHDFDKLPKDNVAGIVNLAGYLPAIMEGYNPQKYIDINVSGTLNILNYAASLNISFYLLDLFF